MHEPVGENQDGERLVWQAMLYASGEMNESESSAFEQRLEANQTVRDALCQAVALSQGPGAALRPSPMYRVRVRDRLFRAGSRWDWLLGQRAYRGHPLLWGLVGAAAVFLLLGPARFAGVPDGPSPQASVPSARSSDGPPLPTPSTRVAAKLQTAYIWAVINDSDHLLKAHDEE